jgi:hypothetical protein
MTADIEALRLRLERTEAFTRAILLSLWGGEDLDGGDIQELGLKHGVIRRTTFDPTRHTDHLGVGAEPGDEWFETALSALPSPPEPKARELKDEAL